MIPGLFQTQAVMDASLGMDAVFSPDMTVEEIRDLIADTDACLATAGDDREASLQREAYAERRARAWALARRLDGCCGFERLLLDGDLHRVRQALAVSCAFFRQRAGDRA